MADQNGSRSNGTSTGNGAGCHDEDHMDTDEERRKRRALIEAKTRELKPGDITGLFDLLEQHVAKTARPKPA